MSWVGAVSILIGLLAIPVGVVNRDRRMLALMILAWAAHIACAYAYYMYVQTQTADTALSYFDPYEMVRMGFATGTLAVLQFVQAAKALIGGTYLDYFLMFQVLGVLGIALMLRSMQEVLGAFGASWSPLMTAMAFMPGTYFWTSAIGKDAPLFLAVALAGWSAMRLKSRWLWFAIALLIMAAIRPHIALIAAAGLAFAVMIGRGLPNYARFGAFVFAAICLVAVGITVQSSLAIDLSSAGSIANYVDNQVDSLSTAAGATDMASMPYFFKLLSLLYRPFFFDYNGIFSLVASLQNVFMIVVTYLLARNWRIWRDMFFASIAVRYATFFLFGMILFLTIIYYNVGLGLRQREMFTPALFFIVTAVFCHIRVPRSLPHRGPGEHRVTVPERVVSG